MQALFGPAGSQQAVTMEPGQHLQLGPMMGDRTVRQVMIAPDGGGIDIIHDNPPGATQSQRVLRLENRNGMLEVIYGTRAMPMPTVTGGTPRLVQGGGGMYRVEYDR